MKPTSGLTYALKEASQTLARGIGTSRHQAERANGGQSPWIHSSRTHDRYSKVALDFVNDCRAAGINRIDKITADTVSRFLHKHIDDGAEKNTIKVEISALNKYLPAMGRADLVINDGIKYHSHATDSGHQTHKFDHPDRVLEKIRNPASRAIAEIEYHTSARIAETKNIRIDEEAKTVSITGKGGLEREIDYRNRVEKFEKVIEAKETLDRHLESHGWQETREQAYRDLHDAERRTREVIQGFHALRANYISERYEELYERHLGEGHSEREAAHMADVETGKEAGHERAGTTHHYRDS
jgi:hypothetical protein